MLTWGRHRSDNKATSLRQEDDILELTHDSEPPIATVGRYRGDTIVSLRGFHPSRYALETRYRGSWATASAKVAIGTLP